MVKQEGETGLYKVKSPSLGKQCLSGLGDWKLVWFLARVVLLKS